MYKYFKHWILEKFRISESESLSQDQWRIVIQEDQQQDYSLQQMQSEPICHDHDEDSIDEELASLNNSGASQSASQNGDTAESLYHFTE